jgi:tetratricopeptide (TPR) repeat protein
MDNEEDETAARLQRELQHVTAAEGYIALGLYLEANEELEQLDPLHQTLPRPLVLKLCVYAGLKQWDLVQTLAAKLSENEPSNAHWALWWASAACRAQSVKAAIQILLHALEKHPNNASIHFNLSCYENRARHYKQARRHLARALQLDPRFRRVLREGNGHDLELLWIGP